MTRKGVREITRAVVVTAAIVCHVGWWLEDCLGRLRRIVVRFWGFNVDC